MLSSSTEVSSDEVIAILRFYKKSYCLYQFLRHRVTDTNLDTYAHPYKEDEKAAIDALSNVTFTGTAEVKFKPVLPPTDDSSSMTI